MTSVYVADLTPEQLNTLREAGKRGESATFSYSFTTGFGLHRLHDQLEMEIEKRGFEIVSSRHDGGMITRTHLIRYRGNAWEAVKFGRALDEYLKRLSSE